MTQILGIWTARRTLSISFFVLSRDSASSLAPPRAFSNLPHSWAICGAFLTSLCICSWWSVTENEHLIFQCLVWIVGERWHHHWHYRGSPHEGGQRLQRGAECVLPPLDKELHTWVSVQSSPGAGCSRRPLLTHPAGTRLCKHPQTRRFFLFLFFLVLIILLNHRQHFLLVIFGRNITKYKSFSLDGRAKVDFFFPLSFPSQYFSSFIIKMFF